LIASIDGILTEASPLLAVIEVNGWGYEVNIPVTTMEQLPLVGNRVKLFTTIVYREDSQTLYGFHNREDRDFFKILVFKVSGIGPKIALSIMSKLSVAILKNAIAASDIELLAKCPGIGKKTAERIVVELRDSVNAVTTRQHRYHGSDENLHKIDYQIQDAVMALVALGYKTSVADKHVRSTIRELGSDVSIEAIIRSALGKL
jgi:Holliday junction DNA helicase RuvA